VLALGCNRSTLPAGGGDLALPARDLALSADDLAAATCVHDAPGASFTFHVHNTGSRLLRLDEGCGGSLPITVDTAGGTFPIAPGAVDACEVNCDAIFAGGSNPGCSDCGAGVFGAVPSGGTLDISWDRRYYVSYSVDAVCSGHSGNDHCGLGVRVDPATTSGTLTVITGGGATTGGPITTSPFNFSFDLTASEATISVN
jgi:hypothetical protein